MSPTAREAILRRIRDANAAAGRSPANTPDPPEPDPVEPTERAELIELFVERAADYKATVRRIGEAEIPGSVAEACARLGVDRLVVPEGLPGDWIPAGVEAVPDDELSARDLDAANAVLTGSRLAIASTGTIVLDSGPGQGRRAITLVPDTHICLIDANNIVHGLDEAFRELADSIGEGRPITFTSGPSATSDIELDRVEGVHGPRNLEILVYG